MRKIIGTAFSRSSASGVAVNLAALWILHVGAGLQANLASALAIEISILSNFLINDEWTFRDRRNPEGGRLNRLGRFHAVSLVGAAIQWCTFVGGNLLLFALNFPAQEVAAYFAVGDDALGRAAHAVLVPPPVGRWRFATQLVGVGLGTAWNFGANLLWTWRASDPADTP